MKQKSKRGVVAIQFSWIFILIIGAIILTFFVFIVQKQSEYASESIANTLQTDLQAILASAQVSASTATIIEMPNTKVNFQCEGGSAGIQIGNQPVATFPYAFAPDVIESERNTMSVYAYDWSIPYRITNFLYTTSPDVRYIFVIDDPTLENELIDILPPPYIEKNGEKRLFMQTEFVTPGEAGGVINKNNYKTRVISFNQEPPNLGNSFSSSDVTEIRIDPTAGTQGGAVYFYEDGGTVTGTYIGEAALLAAIFSESQQIYTCGIDNALKRLHAVSEIYISKAQQLRANTASETCQSLYDNAETNIRTIQSAATTENFAEIHGNADALRSTNENLLANSCQPIY